MADYKKYDGGYSGQEIDKAIMIVLDGGAQEWEEAEKERKSAEENRRVDEAERAAAEVGRQDNEAKRAADEVLREKAEQDRVDENTGVVARATEQAGIATVKAAEAAQAALQATSAKDAAYVAKSDAEIACNAANASKTDAGKSMTAAAASAGTAKNEADRAKEEADRAAEIAGGDYATNAALESEIAAREQHVGDNTKHITQTAKLLPAADDSLALVDSADGGKVKRLVWGNTIAAIKTALNSVYAAVTHSHAWEAITGKPMTFTPSAHTHPASDLSTPVPVNKGGTGANSAAGARGSLEVGKPYIGYATIPTAGWTSGGSFAYAITLGMAGVRATMKTQPCCSVVTSSDAAADKLRIEQFACVSRVVTNDDSITVYCREKIPTVAIPIVVTGEVA